MFLKKSLGLGQMLDGAFSSKAQTETLPKKFMDLQAGHNLQRSPILCLQGTRIDNNFQEFQHYITTTKYNHVVAFDKHGSMILYDHIPLNSCQITTYNG